MDQSSSASHDVDHYHNSNDICRTFPRLGGQAAHPGRWRLCIIVGADAVRAGLGAIAEYKREWIRAER